MMTSYAEYWNYPDKKQSELLKDVNFVFNNIHDEVQLISDSFRTLDGDINDFQRSRLDKSIVLLEKADYYDNKMLELYMTDCKRRKRIKRKELFMIMLFALFIEYYDAIFKESKLINGDIAAEKYRQFTGGNKPPPLPGDIYTKPLPSGVSIKEMIDTEAAYRAERINKALTAAKINDDKFGDINTPGIESEFIRAKNSMLKPSDNGGYHGILDVAMTNIVGYTAIQAAKDTKAKTYTFHAIIDNRTTPACRGLDGRTFKVSEMKLGYNVPPIAFYLNSGGPIPHPCRSWIVFDI